MKMAWIAIAVFATICRASIASANDLGLNGSIVETNSLWNLHLTITNNTDQEVHCMHPSSTFGFISIILMEPDGKPVMPEKVDGPYMPFGNPVVIAPHNAITYAAASDNRSKLSFTFHLQDGLYGYRVESGRKYRLIAIWRPDPNKLDSVLTREIVFGNG